MRLIFRFATVLYRCLSVLFLALALFSAPAQTLNLPPRPANAPNGAQFTNIILNLGVTEREKWVYAQVISGNIPNFQRALKPVTVSSPGHTATYYALPDYLAIGSDANYFRQPMSPLLAQRLWGCIGSRHHHLLRRHRHQSCTRSSVHAGTVAASVSRPMS